jgi:hypothetical protein
VTVDDQDVKGKAVPRPAKLRARLKLGKRVISSRAQTTVAFIISRGGLPKSMCPKTATFYWYFGGRKSQTLRLALSSTVYGACAYRNVRHNGKLVRGLKYAAPSRSGTVSFTAKATVLGVLRTAKASLRITK